MKARVVRIIQITLYILLILFCIGFYIYEVKVNNVEPSRNLTKFVVVIIGCILGLIRGNRRRGRVSLSIYETSFADVIKDAFSYDTKLRKELLIAIRYYDEDKYKKAVKALVNLKSKCRRGDDYYAVGVLLALCFSDMNLYTEAMNEYEEILSRRLETSTVYNNLGHIYSRVGKKKEAMEYYEKAIALSPEYDNAYVNIANLYFYDKEFEPAIEYAMKALDINYKQTAASNLLAIIYALQDDKEKMDKYFHLSVSNGYNPGELKNAIAYYKSSECDL